MKKRFGIVLVIVLAFTLMVGCSGNSGGSGASGGGAGSGASGGNAGAGASSGGGGTAASDDQTWHMIAAYSKNEATMTEIVNTCDRITERTNGRVTFEHFFNYALLSVDEIPRGVASGTADIADMVLSHFPDYFPVSFGLVDLPFTGMTEKSLWAYHQLYDEFQYIEDEYTKNNVKLLGHSMSFPMVLQLTKDIDIRTLNDLNGLKIIATSIVSSAVIAAGGGAAIDLALPDFYNALSSGVADGILVHTPAVLGVGGLELINRIIYFGPDESAGFNRQICSFVINLDTYNSLPPDIQAIFDEEFVRFEIDYKDWSTNITKKQADDILAERNTPGSFLTDEEVATFREPAMVYINENLDKINALGYPGTEMYNRMMEIIREQNAS